jgi:hypothetical protein
LLGNDPSVFVTDPETGFGNIGGIISTYSFVTSDAPFFKKGYAICVSFICLSLVSCAAYAFSIMTENRKRRRQPRDLNLTEHEKTELGVSFSILRPISHRSGSAFFNM